MEGVEHDRRVEEGLGVIGEGRILAEGDGDDIGSIVDGELKAREDGGGDTLYRPVDLVDGDARPQGITLGGVGGVTKEAGTTHEASSSNF
jgi:hypothetical protein